MEMAMPYCFKPLILLLSVGIFRNFLRTSKGFIPWKEMAKNGSISFLSANYPVGIIHFYNYKKFGLVRPTFSHMPFTQTN